MHEPTFRQALSRSWQLVAHKKSLWIFGLLAALIGQMGLSDFVGMLYKITNEGFRLNNYSLFLNFVREIFTHNKVRTTGTSSNIFFSLQLSFCQKESWHEQNQKMVTRRNIKIFLKH